MNCLPRHTTGKVWIGGVSHLSRQGRSAMTCPRTFAAISTSAAVVLAAAVAVPQELAIAEQEAFAAVMRAGEAIERARDGDELSRAAEQAFAAAVRAGDAFNAADLARDAAAAGYRAAYRGALAGAVTCDNGYPCTNDRIDPFDGVTVAFAAHLELIAAVSAANAVFVDAVGIPSAATARARAIRTRELAARMRDVEIVAEVGRWNALVRGVSAEIDASNDLHRRATEARHAKDRTLIDDVNRVMEALYTASARIAQQAAPGSGNTSGASGTASADAAQRTGAALQGTVMPCRPVN